MEDEPFAAGTGYHVLADFIDCSCDERLLRDHHLFIDKLLKQIKAAGLSAENISEKRFTDSEGHGAYTFCITLAESHITAHSWPEIKSVFVDVYVCHVNRHNGAGADRIYKWLRNMFKPRKESIEKRTRGIHTVNTEWA